MAAPPPQSFPYDYLFKVLIIGDASVGKVRKRLPRGRKKLIFNRENIIYECFSFSVSHTI